MGADDGGGLDSDVFSLPKKPTLRLQVCPYRDPYIGILILVYYNPYING